MSLYRKMQMGDADGDNTPPKKPIYKDPHYAVIGTVTPNLRVTCNVLDLLQSGPRSQKLYVKSSGIP
jgi:hypothetical protein